ncbi:MAG: AAA family ATPase [Actinobacteria bacterium]|nr:AAA family ATPase [Actinomycetota bacterium]
MPDPVDGTDVPGLPTGLPEPAVGPVVSPLHGRRDNPDELTRKPLAFWDRIKLLLFFGIAFELIAWAQASNNPLLDVSAAERATAATGFGQILLVLIVLEALRQIHFVLAENVAAYHQLWVRAFARTERLSGRFNPWTRYRIARVIKWVVGLAVIAMVLSAFSGLPPIMALFKVPAWFIGQLPMILQLVLYLFIAVAQFAMIFYFLSRGGVDVYFPDDVKTRFSDVWGQDHVLERVRENVVFLENPEAIEEKGGYVPGGILLWGPPGTGKTLLAEAVAGETGKPYVFVDPGAFINMFFGVGVLKVKSLYRKLRKLSLKYGGVIVFFDEADTLGSRGGAVSQARRVSLEGGVPSFEASTLPACNGEHYVSATTQKLLADLRFEEAQRQLFVPTGTNGGGGMGGGMGTLQALLTEMSGLKKPRGFVNRVIRRTLGMRPKPPPKYRILHIMATNMPDSLDPALLRPGRIDRIYRVGYPSKEGRIETFRNYLDRIKHEVTSEQVENLATIWPNATGAIIKDAVNEALVIAIRDGRDTVTYRDLIKAKSMKDNGLPDGGQYVDRERHSIALHEACHAVAMYRLQHSHVIDTATIERRGDVGGFVAPVPIEEQMFKWRTDVEIDVMTFLASLAGERLFYDGDNTSGVGGDMRQATSLVTQHMLSAAMGDTLRSFGAFSNITMGVPYEGQTADAVEAKLRELYDRTVELLQENRREVLAVAHALEAHKTLSGEDVVAVIEGGVGPLVDGRGYVEPAFVSALEDYHRRAVEAHKVAHERRPALPSLPTPVAAATRGASEDS